MSYESIPYNIIINMSSEGLTLPIVINGTSTTTSTGVVNLLDTFEILLGATSVQLPSFVGYIYNSTTQTTTEIEYAGDTAYTPQYLLTNAATHVLIDITGVIVALNTEPNKVQKRNNIYLCEIQHATGVINDIIPRFDYTTQESNVVGDLVEMLDPLFKGLTITLNGSNLKLNRRAGTILLKNIGTTSTNVVTLAAETKMPFIYTTQDGLLTGPVDDIDPAQYDNSGTLTAVTAGSYTIQRIGLQFDQTAIVQYGDQIYASYSLALNAFTDIGSNFPIDETMDTGIVLAYLIVQEGATNLSSGTSAFLINTDHFGEITYADALSIVNITGGNGSLLIVNNLNDVDDLATAQTNLGAGAANGLAQLDGNSKLVPSQLPVVPQSYYNTARISVINYLDYVDITFLPISATETAGLTGITFILYAEISDRTIDYKIIDEIAASTISTSNITSTGVYTATITKPVSDSLIKLSIKKSAIGGTNPVIKGVVTQLNI